MNDKELVEMLRKEVDSELIDFAGMTYREQVGFRCNKDNSRASIY